MSTQDKLSEALRVFNKVFYKELADIVTMPSDDREYIAREPVMMCVVRLREAIDKLHAARAAESAQAHTDAYVLKHVRQATMADTKDAARYRALRDGDNDLAAIKSREGYADEVLLGDDLDAELDAAMAKESGNE